MREVMDVAARVARTDATVIISGESGTGKNLLARWVHDQSSRANAPFVSIDCGSLPENLLEAELFGFERGAFTGATAAKAGRFEAAQHGTLVLDEISAFTLQSQAKLLRVIEERRFSRLGGNQLFSLDVRLIVLTNADLPGAVARKAFREDLFHRLNVIHLSLPPLRERATDIAPLAERFLEMAGRRHGLPVRRLSGETLAFLKAYDFPGNVRELMHAMERAALTARGELVEPAHLPGAMTSAAALMRGRERKPTLAELEAAYIREILAHTRGHKSKAAAILGISRKNLYEKLRAYDIPYNRREREALKGKEEGAR
jgi:DNA-binding NtrC family response regulator